MKKISKKETNPGLFNYTSAMQIIVFLTIASMALFGDSKILLAQAPGPAGAGTKAPAKKTKQPLTKTGAIKQNITDEDVIRANFGMKHSGEGIQFEILNDFENCEDWRAFSTSPLGDTRVRKVEGKPDIQKFDQERMILQKFQDDNNKRRKEIADNFAKKTGKKIVTPKKLEPSVIPTKYILGVKSYFQEQGFDRVEVTPPNEYIIKGRAKEIRVWVLGRKYRHNLYVKLRDYRGKIHKLKMGRVNFFGWRRMKVTIPGWLPQSSRYALLDKNLHFVSFFVTSDRFEYPGIFYFYLDNFSIVTDVAENRYDGSQILDTW